jgi:hypothetical protein
MDHFVPAPMIPVRVLNPCLTTLQLTEISVTKARDAAQNLFAAVQMMVESYLGNCS